MQVKILLTGFAATAALCLAGVANATTFTWDGSTDSDWDDPSNWDLNSSYPQAGDTAIIKDVTNQPILNLNVTIASLQLDEVDADMFTDQYTLTVTAAGGLEVASGAILYLQDAVSPSAGGTLVLSGGGTHPIGGQVILDHANSEIQITNDTDETIFGPEDPTGTPGFGFIVLDDAGAVIKIEEHSTSTRTNVLINRVQIVGFGVIQPVDVGDGTAMLRNSRASSDPASGVVRADTDAQTLELACDLEIDDMTRVLDGTTYRPTWEALNGGTLRFDCQAASSLEGDFKFDSDGCAESTFLLDAADLVTAGALSGDGNVETINGGSFDSSNETCSSGTCEYGDCV